MNAYLFVTCHLNPHSRSENKAQSESGLEVGSPEFAAWALQHKKFKFHLHWQPLNYAVIYRITCYLRSDQSWYASKYIGGIFKQHELGKTQHLSTAKLIEAVQWLCPDPQMIVSTLPPESEAPADPIVPTRQPKFSQALYYQILLEIEDLQQQLEQLWQDNQQLKLDREQLSQQESQSLKINQELQTTIAQLIAERKQHQEQLQNLTQIVHDLGSKLQSVNLKTNPRWYYANRYYQQLRDILNPVIENPEQGGED